MDVTKLEDSSVDDKTTLTALVDAVTDTGSSTVVIEEPELKLKTELKEEESSNKPVKSPDEKQIDDGTLKQQTCAQVEFYFADSNLPYDRFMWSLHTANDQHWVPVATVASFKRMREYSKNGNEWVAEALMLSKELELDETKTKVRRRTEVKEPEGQFERSIYAKGFGKEEPGIQEELEKFFRTYGNINAVRMRRVQETKEFKGSVFVEFSDFKDVNTFLNADPKPTWKGQELLIMTKEAYCDLKIKEKGIKGKDAILRKQNNFPGGRKGFNAFREMEKDSKSNKGGNSKAKPEIWLEFMGAKIRVYEEDGGSVKEEDVPYVKGSALKFSGCGGKVNFDDIKKPLKEKFLRAPFVQYKQGNDWGVVGFDKALSEEEIIFVRDTIKTLDGKEIIWSPADEGEEKASLIERVSSAAQKAFSSSQGSGRGGSRGMRGRGRGRGGRGGGGGGRGRSNNHSNSRDSKPQAAKAESPGGEKRKRAVEPDGSADTGTRGQGVPAIQSSKKLKTDEGTSIPVAS